MSGVERDLTTMHETVNKLNEAQTQLAAILASIPADEKVRGGSSRRRGAAGQAQGVGHGHGQRRSRAYDDVENFAQKFTANWLFLINATESDLPRVNQPSRERYAQLQADWTRLKARSDAMVNVDIPSMNRKLWELGLGPIWKIPTPRIVP